MIAAAIAWLVKKGVSERVAPLLCWGALALLIGLAVVLWLTARDAEVIKNHEAKTSAKLERTGRQADTSAAQRVQARRRAEDTARKDFDNATAGIPDQGLSDRQRLDLCRELRDAGTDTALLPECSDVRAGGQAGP
jgi:hypothetical protein